MPEAPMADSTEGRFRSKQNSEGWAFYVKQIEFHADHRSMESKKTKPDSLLHVYFGLFFSSD
ncbi:unnamed protein product [Fusarium graminearum]|uniref:Uncharacterized protein n=1 Tax=Gibberella zeae TaxID=5518 RepID=A0A4E9E351_GIBZA|nr:unnamed protein product [Fusarium graminearum]CAF3558813.1 unnamed protein product [Fusarium graminearum]CAG1999163.1 unnamed protein product [Fusarium graminearum]CAG2010597.1 unnamed protein product [Fusarium graminearum]